MHKKIKSISVQFFLDSLKLEYPHIHLGGDIRVNIQFSVDGIFNHLISQGKRVYFLGPFLLPVAKRFLYGVWRLVFLGLQLCSPLAWHDCLLVFPPLTVLHSGCCLLSHCCLLNWLSSFCVKYFLPPKIRKRLTKHDNVRY